MYCDLHSCVVYHAHSLCLICTLVWLCLHVSIYSQWQEGLLPQLLRTSRGEGNGGSSNGEGGRGGRWVVLDGVLSSSQLDTLLTLVDTEDKVIKLSNGRGIPIDSSCRFILEVHVHVHV